MLRATFGRRSVVKFYDSLGPNPRLVRMFMLEKGIAVPAEQVDIMGGANRRAPYTDKNPAGQLPALELDNGLILGETVAICEYLEDKNPNPPLIGRTPEEKAETRMWTRRIELKITGPLADGFRFAEGIAMFKDRMRTLPEAAAGLKAIAADVAGGEGVSGAALVERYQGTEFEKLIFRAQAAGVEQNDTPESAVQEFHQALLALRVRRMHREIDELRGRIGADPALNAELNRRVKELHQLKAQRS